MDRKYTIAYLDYSHIFAGAEQVLYTIIANLDRSKYEPILVFPYPMEHQQSFNTLNCQKFWLNKNLKFWMGRDRWENPMRGTDFVARSVWGVQLAHFLKKKHVDILHVNLLRPDCLMWLLPVKLQGIKVIGHFRSQFKEWVAPRLVQKCCDLILCVSEFTRSQLLSSGEFTRSIVLYDSINFDKFSSLLSREEAKEKLGFPKDCLLLVSVGQLSRHKGHDQAIRAFAKIMPQVPNAWLFIAGGGPDLDYLKALSLEFPTVKERIVFSEVQVPYINDIYRGADLVLSLTRIGEAFGLVPYEACLLNTPCIAPNRGAITEFMAVDEPTLLVNPDNVGDIVAKILWTLHHPDITNRLMDTMLQIIYTKLTPQIMTFNLMKEYDAILTNA